MLESYCLVGLTEQSATIDIISSHDLITLISTYEGSQMCSETPRCAYFECNKRHHLLCGLQDIIFDFQMR